MKRSNQRKSRRAERPTLPELDQTKRSVLNSVASQQSRRSYQHAMEEFIDWYCSEPRLALNRGVVLRYRMQLETRQLAPATINVRLAAVRRLVYEAADTGLLSSELVAGIRRVKVFHNWAVEWEIGSPPRRARNSFQVLIDSASGASVTRRSSLYCLAAASGAQRS